MHQPASDVYCTPVCVRHNVQNGFEWMKGYQLGCCYSNSSRKTVVGLTHEVVVGTERASWALESVELEE